MQTDIADTIYQRVKILPVEKQRDILRHVEELNGDSKQTIWQKIRERSARIPAEAWQEMPTDGSEQHDHYLNGTAKK